ncbi:TIGR04141 family sporadically distributed protein [Liquorilactobacillus uvarum]|uniref:Uncharacterized protein n=1 Tax=Liquorilactobacillus uvarum DSM 19971 TaxID=1423812 RepID=A0A0R1Q798_9LACO|nr:TIGR04141 family sporadically distributed protein [Liquorilactobacillus uvarum]KRL38082.1 hypothetical protein FD20_GL002349 [Liquorilactobacillus uvarum DSM 19971]
MISEGERIIKTSIFLHKESVESFDDCLKEQMPQKNIYELKKSVGLEGKIYVSELTQGLPDWCNLVNKLAVQKIEFSKNASNKAVIVMKYKDRFFSITYGYGRSLLKESSIERNFGLKVAANLVSTEKLKSLNSIKIEETLVETQKQASEYTTQDQFQLNKSSELLKSIAGSPKDEKIARFLLGTDCLVSVRKMKIENIKENIIFYYDKYKKNDYR